MRNFRGLVAATAIAAMLSSAGVAAPQPDFNNYSEAALHAALAKSATVQSKLLMPMRDGVGLATDIYLPKDAKGPLPTIFWRTPYDYNQVNGSLLHLAVEAVSHGYAFVIQNERGRYFSEGKFEILGYPRTDETSLGFERALSNDVRLSVTGVYRDNKNIIGSVLPSAQWAPFSQVNGVFSGYTRWRPPLNAPAPPPASSVGSGPCV